MKKISEQAIIVFAVFFTICVGAAALSWVANFASGHALGFINKVEALGAPKAAAEKNPAAYAYDYEYGDYRYEPVEGKGSSGKSDIHLLLSMLTGIFLCMVTFLCADGCITMLRAPADEAEDATEPAIAAAPEKT